LEGVNPMLVTGEKDRPYSEKVSDYKRKLSIMQIENEQLKTISEKDSKIIKLESEREALLSYLGNGSDIIPSILNLQQKFNALQEENGRLKDENQESKEEIISLTKELEKLLEVHQIQLKSKDMIISELEEKFDLKILKRKVEELEEHNKRTELQLTNKVSELLEQKTAVENQLKKSVVDNINSLQREEEAVIELDQEMAKNANLANEYEALLGQVKLLEKYKEIGIQSEILLKEINQLEMEHRDLTGEYQSLSAKYEFLDGEHKELKSDFDFLVKHIHDMENKHKNLVNRYNALKDSKLGKLTIRYWKLSKKWAKGRQR
jgi:chromosome segregation ATPase